MAYDEALAARIRAVAGALDGIAEKRMFGGVGYILRGNMAVGIMGTSLIVRVGPDDEEAALSEPHTARFAPTGRPMRGWITVAAEGLEEESELRSWVAWGLRFAAGLQPK